jgi:carbonic anhydrase
MKKVYLFIFVFIINFSLILNDDNDDLYKNCTIVNKSPINIDNSNVREISLPPLKIERSYYPSFGNIKLNSTDMSLTPNNWETARLYINHYNTTLKYQPKKIYVRIFSEHSFENLKYDIELQIFHELKEPVYDPQNENIPEFLCISIFFDSGRNKKSKIFEQFYKTKKYEEDLTKKYIFKNIENIDLNLYINFNDPYYFYEGSGTSPDENQNDKFNCNKNIYWILMKKVNPMSEEEFNNLRLAYYREEKKKNGQEITLIKKSRKPVNLNSENGPFLYYFENKKETNE